MQVVRLLPSGWTAHGLEAEAVSLAHISGESKDCRKMTTGSLFFQPCTCDRVATVDHAWMILICLVKRKGVRGIRLTGTCQIEH